MDRCCFNAGVLATYKVISSCFVMWITTVRLQPKIFKTILDPLKDAHVIYLTERD